MKYLLLVYVFSMFSVSAFSQHQNKNMDSKMHATHMKCMEKNGKSMEECMSDKNCKECVQKMDDKQMKQEDDKKKK